VNTCDKLSTASSLSNCLAHAKRSISTGFRPFIYSQMATKPINTEILKQNIFYIVNHKHFTLLIFTITEGSRFIVW